MAPGIDPLDPRNLELEPRLPGRVVRSLGVDLDRPFVLQTLELDRWDDPHATIECFRARSRGGAGPQLVLAAQFDAAATEAWRAAKEVSDYSAGTEDLLLLTSYEPLGSLEVGALEHLARVVLEMSMARGSISAPARRCGSNAGGGRRADGGPASPCATGWTASSPTVRRRPRGGSWSWSATRAGRGDGPRGPGAGARALPGDRGRRTGAARAGGAGLTPVHRRITGYRGGPVKVLLPDGKELELSDGATGADAAGAIGPGLARAALGIRVSANGAEPDCRT